MSYFVVAGISECCMYNHVKLISNILSDRLPNFKVKFIQLGPLEWKTWVKNKNLQNKWYHLTSPLIWKELTMRGGKAHLIGGASEFWEYCYDYYNLECLLPNNELDKLVADTQQYIASRKEIEKKEESKKQQIIICLKSIQNKGDVLTVLLMRLLDRVKYFAPKEVVIRIPIGNAFIDDLDELSIFEAKIELIANMKEGLANADLFIIVGDYSRAKGEDLYKWLSRNKNVMEQIADEINENAKQSLRVINGIHGPVCFSTAILLENVTKIHLYNIVAQTCDVGLEPLSLVSKLTQMPLEDLSAPPVWGFIGVNQIIDLEHIVQRYDVYRPNIRAVKNNFGSTLQLGKKHTELRYLSYLYDKFKTVWVKLKNKQDTSQHLYHVNRLSKVRGIMAVIDSWYFPKLSENIISLGLLTNGSFEIPSGIVFSQPVILKNDRWTPMKTFPVPRKDPCGIDDLIPFVIEIYRHFKIREEILLTI